jgi:hypothetical protein
MSYTREDVRRQLTEDEKTIDHHKKDLLDCIVFLTKIKKTFTMDEVHDLLSKYGKNGRGRTGNYTTIVREFVEMKLLIKNDNVYKLSPITQYFTKGKV